MLNQPGGQFIFTGTLSNTGQAAIVNLTLVNDQPASNTLVLGPITLATGATGETA